MYLLRAGFKKFDICVICKAWKITHNFFNQIKSVNIVFFSLFSLNTVLYFVLYWIIFYNILSCTEFSLNIMMNFISMLQTTFRMPTFILFSCRNLNKTICWVSKLLPMFAISENIIMGIFEHKFFLTFRIDSLK